eukprot:6156-Heterococcus_DN1.PRE.12
MKLLLLSFPRQASKFFVQALDQCSLLKYKESYFDPLLCNEAYREQVAKFWSGNVYKPSDESSLLHMLDTTMMKDDVTLVLDRYSSLKIPILKQRFRLIIVYRERKYSFPSSKMEDMLMLFDKFTRATFRPDSEHSSEHNVLMSHLDKLQSLVRHVPVTEDNDKCITVHMISSFIKFYYARLYSIPIIRYEQLMSLDEDRLRAYLRKRLTYVETLDLNALVEYIVSRRDIEALNAKAAYNARSPMLV